MDRTGYVFWDSGAVELDEAEWEGWGAAFGEEEADAEGEEELLLVSEFVFGGCEVV